MTYAPTVRDLIAYLSTEDPAAPVEWAYTDGHAVELSAALGDIAEAGGWAHPEPEPEPEPGALSEEVRDTYATHAERLTPDERRTLADAAALLAKIEHAARLNDEATRARVGAALRAAARAAIAEEG